MPRTALAVAGLAALLAAPASPASAAVGTPGPFAGVLRQSEWRTHVYDNNPTRSDCLQIVSLYTVSLDHVPATDRLTLTVGGVSGSVTSSGGHAEISLVRSWCTSFTVTVSGTAVRDVSAYTVNVTRNSPA